MSELLNLSSLLDFGVLGVLVAVLVVVGRYAQVLISKLFKLLDVRIKNADANQEAQLKAWKELTQEYIENQVKTADALERISDQSTKAHAAILESIQGGYATFIRWHEQGASERKLMMAALQEALDQAKDVRINGHG